MILTPVLLVAACVAVDGERILVSDLARALPVFAQAPGGEDAGLAPSPGGRRTLGVRELELVAARYQVQLPPGAAACFERRLEPLDRERVLAALAPALRNTKGTWELLEVSRYPAPPGGLEFLEPRRVVSGVPVVVRGWVRYAPNRSFPVWARVRITQPPRAVEPGAMVAVEVPCGGALLKLEARAETGGETGETVVVRNPATKVRFSARVAGPGKVTVDAKISSKNPGARPGGSLREPGR
jgi:hypothetical protein